MVSLVEEVKMNPFLSERKSEITGCRNKNSHNFSKNVQRKIRSYPFCQCPNNMPSCFNVAQVGK